MTSHDLMRKAMREHGITADEIVDEIVRDLGGDRELSERAVARFVNGGPGTVGVHASIVGLSMRHEQAIKH